MAFPLLLPTLFALGSAGANYIGNQQAENARSDRLAAERIRQKQLDAEADAANTKSRDRYKDFKGQQEDRKLDLQDMYRSTEAALPIAPQTAVPQSDNITISTRAAGDRADAKAFTDQRADALAEFRSFGDLLGGIGRSQARDAQDINMLSGFKRGSQSVLPLELDAASQKGGGWRFLGDILNLGSAATMGPALGGTAMPGSGGLLAGLFGGSKPLNAANVVTNNAKAGATFGGSPATGLAALY